MRFHGVDPHQLAHQHPVVAAMLTACRKPCKGIYKARIPEMVAESGLSSSTLVQQLQQLAAARQVSMEPSRTNAFCYQVGALCVNRKIEARECSIYGMHKFNNLCVLLVLGKRLQSCQRLAEWSGGRMLHLFPIWLSWQ